MSSAGDVYVAGLTGPGFPVTPSAPEICFQGATSRTNGFVAHLNSMGALLNATYLGNSAGGDINFIGGLLPLVDSSVLVAWHEEGNSVVSKVQFGSGGWTAPACLSPNARPTGDSRSRVVIAISRRLRLGESSILTRVSRESH